VIPQQGEPVRLVAAFSLGEGEQDVAFLAQPVLGKIAVDGGFRPFVREVLAPPLDVRSRRCVR
jgi:hypothetical protein